MSEIGWVREELRPSGVLGRSAVTSSWSGQSSGQGKGDGRLKKKHTHSRQGTRPTASTSPEQWFKDKTKGGMKQRGREKAK